MRVAMLASLLTACGSPPRAPTAQATPPGFESGEPALIATDDPVAINARCEATRATLERLRDAALRSHADHLVPTIVALDRAAWNAKQTIATLADQHPDAAIRTAAAACRARIDEFVNDVRVRLAPRVRTAHGLSNDDAAYLRSIATAADREGASLPDDRLRELAALRKRGSALVAQIRGVVGTPPPPLVVPVSRLAGIPEPFLATHLADPSGNVTLDPIADAGVIAAKATDRALATELRAQRLRLPAERNLDPLRELLDVRRRSAVLLGCPSFVECAARSRMVGSAERKRIFLASMTSTIRSHDAAYLDALGLSPDARPPATDLDFLEDRFRTRRGDSDLSRWLAYYEVEPTLGRVLDAVGDATGLRFIGAAPPAWPSDALAFDVFRGDVRVGRFVFDLYLRPGKIPGTGGASPIVTRVHGDPLGRPVVTTWITLTIPHAPGDRPTTFPNPRYLTTLLHEIGHSIDFLYERQSALAPAEWDFFDVPSQIAERWMLDDAFLSRVGRDPTTGAAIPREGVDAIVRDVTWTRWWRVRLLTMVGLLDFAFHGEQVGDAGIAYDDAYRSVFTFAPEPGHPEAVSFMPVLVYEGNSHALIWGLAISTDVATSFGREGLANRTKWREFLERVSGGSGPAEARLAAFLGRPWSTAPLAHELAALWTH